MGVGYGIRYGAWIGLNKRRGWKRCCGGVDKKNKFEIKMSLGAICYAVGSDYHVCGMVKVDGLGKLQSELACAEVSLLIWI